MDLFLISYDLNNPGQNYNAVYAVLNSWGAKRVLESTWMMRSTVSAAAIRNALGNGPLDANDGLVVVRVDDWASIGGMTKIKEI